MTQTILVSAAVALCCVPLWGQQTNAPDLAAQNAALEQHVRELEDRLIAVEGKVRMLQSAQAAPEAQGTPASAPATPAPPQLAPVPSPNLAQTTVATSLGQLSNYGGASSAAKALNPDISAIGDFITAAGGNTAPPLATLQPFRSPH
jgi:hypothetical protein